MSLRLPGAALPPTSLLKKRSKRPSLSYWRSAANRIWASSIILPHARRQSVLPRPHNVFAQSCRLALIPATRHAPPYSCN